MEKYKETLFSILNIALILAVIVGIVIGLYFLGIFKMPDFVERILFGTDYSVTDTADNSNSVYKSISSNDSSLSQVQPDITPENLKQILENIVPKSDYYHEATTTLFTENKSLVQNVTIRKQDGFYQVLVFDGNGLLIKEIQEFDDTVDITYYDETEQGTAASSILSSNFDISDQTGALITHEYFLDSLSDVDSASYDLTYEEYGTVVKLSFLTSLDDYVQKQIYWLSLDYGVVVKAQSYENDAIVYQMKTIALTDI